MTLLDRRALRDITEVQMLFRRIHSPAQQQEKDCHQTGERDESGKKLPESTDQRPLWCWRKSHAAKTWRTGKLSFLVRYTFTTERSSAMRTSRRRFTQWMKQTVSVTQARRGAFVKLTGWFIRSHSSAWHPRWEWASRNLRSWFGRAASPILDLSLDQPVAGSPHEQREPPYRFSQEPCALGARAPPRAVQRLHQLCGCAILLSAPAPALAAPTRNLCRRKPLPSQDLPIGKKQHREEQITPRE